MPFLKFPVSASIGTEPSKEFAKFGEIFQLISTIADFWQSFSHYYYEETKVGPSGLRMHTP